MNQPTTPKKPHLKRKNMRKTTKATINYVTLMKNEKKTNKFTSRNQPRATNKTKHNLPPKAISW